MLSNKSALTTKTEYTEFSRSLLSTRTRLSAAQHQEKILLVFEKDKLGPRIRMGDTTKFVVRLVAATLDQTIQSTMYYLSDYAGSPGTSKPTYYNVFLDENNFTYVTHVAFRLSVGT
jgi:hypothetical protein